MQALLSAVYSQVLSSLVGTFPAWTPPPPGASYPVSYFQDIAPAGAPFPRLIGSMPSSSGAQSKYGPSTLAYSQVTFRFSVYGELAGSVTLATIAGYADAVTAVFDNLLLTLSSGKMTNTWRNGEPVPRLDPAKSKNGNDVWSFSWTYTWTFGR